MTSAIFPHVDIYIWLAKDHEGYTTTSSRGGMLSTRPDPGDRSAARCGHVSMTIAPDRRQSIYVSLWPHGLVSSLGEDQRNEGSLPDVILRLHSLDVPAMLNAFNQVKSRVACGQIQWDLAVSDSADVTNPANTKASCATFVLAILKAGGLLNPALPYCAHVSARGPKEARFYHLTKCSAGDRWGGIFNGAPWTARYFSPKALLLRVASAVEAVPQDQEATSQIMCSSQVATEREVGSARTTAMVALAGAALLIGAAAMKK